MLASWMAKESGISRVEAQTEEARKSGSIWGLLLEGNIRMVEKALRDEPALVDARGAVGETILHLCFLYNKPVHLTIARSILGRYPNAIKATYEGEDYMGENCLHIAIVNKDFSAVKFLVEREPTLLRGRATGKFFRPGQPCYYGEYPLFFAACSNQRDIVDFLLLRGADINAVDSEGNSILHLLVIHGLREMYDYIEKKLPEYQLIHVSKRTNKLGLTPLTLAASIGKPDMFSHLVEKGRETEWHYGPVQCNLYPLSELDFWVSKDPRDDTLGGVATTHQKGALQYIIENEHVELLMHPRIVELLKKKWDRFAGYQFKFRLVLFLMYLVFFTIATILRPGEDPSFKQTYEEVTLRLVAEIVVVAGAMYKLFREIREMMHDGIVNYFTRQSTLLENYLSIAYVTSVTILTFLRLLSHEYEDAAMSIAAICVWSYMLFFFLGFRLTGPFVVMIYKMLVADVLRFGIISTVFLFGFSTSFFILRNESGFTQFVRRTRSSFMAMTLVGFDVDDLLRYITARFPSMAVVLMITFIVVVSILLLNLLIAMMGDTYARISQEADKRWHLEWARIIFSVENEMGESERLHPENKYWTMINGKRYLQVLEVNDGLYTGVERGVFGLDFGMTRSPTMTPGMLTREATSFMAPASAAAVAAAAAAADIRSVSRMEELARDQSIRYDQITQELAQLRSLYEAGTPQRGRSPSRRSPSPKATRRVTVTEDSAPRRLTRASSSKRDL